MEFKLLDICFFSPSIDDCACPCDKTSGFPNDPLGGGGGGGLLLGVWVVGGAYVVRPGLNRVWITKGTFFSDGGD